MAARTGFGIFPGCTRSSPRRPVVSENTDARVPTAEKSHSKVDTRHPSTSRDRSRNESAVHQASELKKLPVPPVTSRHFARRISINRLLGDQSTKDSCSTMAKSNTASRPLPLTFFRTLDPHPDERNRTLQGILSWPDDDLEHSHNYIQYLFPLPERSPYNPFAPLIDEKVFKGFRAQTDEGKDLRSNLRKAFERMLAFYGFKLERLNQSSLLSANGEQELTCKIARSDNYESRFEEWVRPFDHNHLRITRIIRCLRLLGLEEEAQSFHAALVQLSGSSDGRGRIRKTSLKFWERAAKRPLWNAPEDDDGVVGEGCQFLVEWEKSSSGD